MMHTTKVLSTVTILGSLLTATACAPDVLTFEEPTPSSSTLPRASALNLAGDKTLAALSDDEAGELCSWLSAKGQSGASPDDESSPGYSAGGGASGFTSPIDSRSLVWVRLNKRQCLLNLRHSACEATVSSLKGCITYFAQDFIWDSNPFDWKEALAACADYEASPSCSETVLQHSFVQAGDAHAPPGPECGVVPIAPNAVPPRGCVRAD
jgi:hypothetical protein